MHFYPMSPMNGTAVPALAWTISEKLMDTKTPLPKLTIISLVREAWKIQAEKTCSLITCKEFVEWMAANKNYKFVNYQ